MLETPSSRKLPSDAGEELDAGLVQEPGQELETRSSRKLPYDAAEVVRCVPKLDSQLTPPLCMEPSEAEVLGVSHHVHQDGGWVRKRPSSHPSLTVRMCVDNTAYGGGIREAGGKKLEKTRQVDALALPDTGAQLCLAEQRWSKGPTDQA